MKKHKLQDEKSRISADDIDNCPDIDSLRKMKVSIEASMVEVKEQIDTAAGVAAADGAYADPKWWAKANSYKRVLGFLHQKIAHKEREFKSLRESTPQTIEKEFMSVAKTVLVPETFYEILSIVHRRLAISAE